MHTLKRVQRMRLIVTIKPGEEPLVVGASRYEECGLGARTEAQVIVKV